MQVLNRQERNVSFIWFLLFFIITVGLFVLAVFFNYQVPARENAALRKELTAFREEQAFQATFLQKLDKVKHNLDSINLPNQNATYMDQIIAASLADMRNSIPKEAVTHFGLYDNIVQNCLSLQQTKQQLRELQNAQQNIAGLKEQVADLNRQLETKSRDLDNCRQMMLLNSRAH
ncbi:MULTISPECIES: type VI secretion system TssO [Chitinophaga]|uniref:Type VI secretion system transmembrane protein TssO n=1 Tax=Chitinophaga eiseniae TaxID=634771 RepID=A0A847SQN8_9BACT|nr:MULTISPECIES: type VI secretion system TssO [Chitinophaga]NLR79786.1 type VI secretion system transmembrane protein TssO [Chitinophaga eiseniae]NLU91608.1 type VI secretion system transmembrane protein TssO [Chitinophaga sp. Ak27]